MTEHSLWRLSHALRGAIDHGQIAAVAALVDDDVEWAIYGPIDMFPFLGARRGKAAALEALKQIADNVRIRRYEREQVVLGDEQGSFLTRFSLTTRDHNQPISVRAATFARFKDGRLISLRMLLDTFDLVEQALGQPIHLPTAV